MPHITLPDGVQTIATDGSDRITGRSGDTVRVLRGQADAIRRHVATRTTRPAGTRFALGTRAGRSCPDCRRRWQVWTVTCPKCGTTTEPEPVCSPTEVPDDAA